MIDKEHLRRTELVRAIRGYYDPIHPIKVKLSCPKCDWTDEFTVKLLDNRVKERKHE